MSLRAVAIGLMLACCAHPRAPQQTLPPEAPTPTAPAPATTAPAADSAAAAAASAPASSVQSADFTRDIRPILESRCQPCHFTGGKMYDRLPFDKPETIRQLGERLFTRIKAENEQALIRQFLAQGQ